MSEIPLKKTCRYCNETLPVSFFQKTKLCRDGYAFKCYSCRQKKIKYKKGSAVGLLSGVNSCSKEYRRLNSLNNRKENFKRQMLYGIKASAKKRGLEFNLTISDIVIPEKCPYLDIKITRKVGKGKTNSNPSVDRIDNTKGYIKGNIEVISDLANTMKRDCSIEQLLTFSRNTIKRFS